MTYRETCILLPCHSLEDFPMHFEGEEADGLLAAWTALWHPALLATTGSAPSWHRGDSPPDDLSDLLILVPGVSENELPTGFTHRAREEGARVIQGNLSRAGFLAQALEPIAEEFQGLDGDVVADFLALGFAYLQVELLTRQMRYSTNLDELHFYNQVVEGAKLATVGDDSGARDQLAACFDLLAQERDHYYAVDAYVLDITLLAPTTLGDTLCQQLEQEVPTNLLLTADLLEQMSRAAPATLAALRSGLEAGRIGLIGGDQVEQRTPLHSCETVLRRLRRGLATFQQRLGERPQVYGRCRCGLSVLYPQLLHRLGYVGALHAALGEGRCPEGSQLKVRWEGPDHQPIDSIGRVPLNAAEPAPFLSLASKLGETMDMDHVATICLAHWPGHVCTWYDDLRRIARYGAMLGKFVTINEYFRDTDYPGQTEQFKADQYTAPYLPQAVAIGQTDPLSTSIRYWRRRCQAAAIEAMEMMQVSVSGQPSDRAASLIDQIDSLADDPTSGDLDDSLGQSLEQTARELAQLVPRGDEPPESGYMVLNPSSSVRRATLDLPELTGLPSVTKPVYAAASHDRHKYVVVDVPPMGFVWVTGSPPAKPSRRPPRPLADENRLYNDFFEAEINTTTGTLQSLFEYEKRGNRLSQQLAVRGWRDQGSTNRKAAAYSVMAADRVRVTATSTVMGEITSEGRLLDRRGRVLATYEQRYRAWRGSRVLQLDVQLDPLAELKDDPWNSYYCCRLAWASESALLWRGVNQLRERAEAKRFEAPNYIDIDDNGRHTTLLTGGLPFHRRTDLRMLDTLLIVKGETARSFQLGIGVNLGYPMQDSMAQMVPLPLIHVKGPPVAGPTSSWLFHIDCRNVVATAWLPIVEDGTVTGACARLLETAGRSAHVRLRAFRDILSAERRDFDGENTRSCGVEAGAAVVELGANEWMEVAVRWSEKGVEPNEV